MLRWIVTLFFLLLSRNILASQPYVFHHENILGTSLEIKLNANSEANANQAEAKILGEITRLSDIYSTWDSDSEMRKWMDGEDSEKAVSQEMIDLFRMCEELWTTSQGAFDPRVGHAVELWKQAAKENRVPTDKELIAAVTAIQQQAWRIDTAKKSIQRVAKVPLTFDGIAKGLIVDGACEIAMKCDGIKGVLINIGGDLRLAGNFQDKVIISDPKSPAKTLLSFVLAERAIATSGNYHRGLEIGEQSYSHILDPKTAKPVEHVISASVIADNAATADALATAFSVLTVNESLEVCKSQPQIACLLVTSDGKSVASPGWPDSLASVDQPVATTMEESDAGTWNTGAELQIDFEINRVDGRGYRRPYVAVWIEDAKQKPVKTLVLWMQTSNPGPRWHRDLKRWYKQNGARKLADGKNLIGTVSAATKPAGAYKAAWDGNDDNGKPVKKGKYTLYVEVAREHGTYQLLSKEIVLADEPTKGELGKNVEIKSVKFEYAPKGSAK